jgi:hypothetical protein
MALNTVVTGNTVLASDVNQLVQVLQRASSQTEAGKYYIIGWGSASGDNIGHYCGSLSRVSTPVSVSVDTADVAVSNINSPSTTDLTSGGFEIFSTTTGAATNAHVAGNTTIQF